MGESAENRALSSYMDALEEETPAAARLQLQLATRDLGYQGLSEEEAMQMFEGAKNKVDQARQAVEELFSDE